MKTEATMSPPTKSRLQCLNLPRLKTPRSNETVMPEDSRPRVFKKLSWPKSINPPVVQAGLITMPVVPARLMPSLLISSCSGPTFHETIPALLEGLPPCQQLSASKYRNVLHAHGFRGGSKRNSKGLQTSRVTSSKLC